MEYNGLLEHLEQQLYKQLEGYLEAERFEEARQIVQIMDSCGIV